MIVYQHRRNDNNEVFYVGIGSRKDRYSSKRSRSNFWYSIVNKVGYIPEILFNDVDELQAKQIEKYLISYYGRRDLGLGNLVNMTDGEDGTYNHSLETRKKMGANNIGKIPWNKGIPMSAKSKLKCSTGNMGRTSPRKGIKLSIETKLKLSKAKKGNTNAKGAVRTDDMKKVMSKNNTKYQYLMYSLDGELLKTFDSMMGAVNYSGSNRSSITRASTKQQKTANGFVWDRKLKTNAYNSVTA